MSETLPDEYNPYEDPSLLEQANGDTAYLRLLVDENVAAASLYEDAHNEDKLISFTTKRDAVIIYEAYLKYQAGTNPNDSRP